MAILKKGQTGKTLLMGISLAAVLAIFVPAVSAYEAHLINVKAHVEERFNVFKTIRLATADEIQYLVDLAVDPDFTFPPDENYPPNPDGVDPEYPDDVPVNTLVVWMVTLWVNNPHDYDMTEVVVTDHFGAELGGEGTNSENVTGALDFFIKEHSRGNSTKGSFETQYRITWYVTGDEEDNSGVLESGDAAYMEMLVWTKLNPSGRQEYTSPGYYTLNSGPTGKWYDAPPDEGGHQFSFEGEPIYIYVFE